MSWKVFLAVLAALAVFVLVSRRKGAPSASLPYLELGPGIDKATTQTTPTVGTAQLAYRQSVPLRQSLTGGMARPTPLFTLQVNAS